MCVSIRHPDSQVGTGYDFISPPSRLFLFVWSPGGDAHGPSQHAILSSDRCPTHGHFCFFSLLTT